MSSVDFSVELAQGKLADFRQALVTLQDSVASSQIEGRSLQQQFLTSQQLYQQQLVPILTDAPSASAFVPYQTEISRALRLLGMDVAFLQSAKNPLTQQRRQAQMQQRLERLLEFVRGLQAALETEGH